jgi:uncharacterized protein
MESDGVVLERATHAEETDLVAESRRNFLRTGVRLTTGAFAASSLAGLVACNAAEPSGPDGDITLRRAPRGSGGYGPISLDPGGLPFLIPAGFRLRQISRAGDPMKRSGAGPVPNAFDGMAAFAMSNGNIRLIRNHEIRDSAAASVPFGSRPWDTKAGGGCTSLEVAVDPVTGEPSLVDEFPSISGTMVNCAGGPTPWGTWLTCEETVEGTASGRDRNHGYVFEIPASANAEVEPVPLRAMGRFSHEAVAVDTTYGHVYETEDAGTNSGFYRYIPNVLGNMAAGGRLQMLALDGRERYNSTGGGTPVGVPLPASWVDIDDPDPATLTATNTCFQQGLARGGTRFARLEGCWWSSLDTCVYFNATSGGAAGAGQVWQYKALSANAGQLTLIFESPSRTVLDSPDNICVSPRGGLVICEDGAGGQFIRGLTRDGRIFDLVRTEDEADATEFAGSCFSPDGRILFFNSQGSTTRLGTERGGTFALMGPWASGAL